MIIQISVSPPLLLYMIMIVIIQVKVTQGLVNNTRLITASPTTYNAVENTVHI
jgi:hypothetical protein